MKKRHLLFGGLALLPSLVNSQSFNATSAEKINKTQVDIVYNHYVQDGDNSAITGGIGTEKLTVYGPAAAIKKIWDKNSFTLNFGTDIISSASTDKIDFVMSSASALDYRTYVNGAYEHTFEEKNISIFGGASMSVESDYFSIGNHLGFVKVEQNGLTHYSVEFIMYNDDLRWRKWSGPEHLIYPVELRYQEWYNDYRRNSYNLKFGFTKAINKRSIIGVFPVFSYQNGLLATPFHRIFFSDGSLAVEKLPDRRIKGSVALKWNHFLGGNLIVKNTINPYLDNFEIAGISIENETAIKLNAIWTLLPNARFYTQQGSPYFSPFQEHDSESEFYSSDYDLSTFQTYNVGMGFRFAPFTKMIERKQFNAMTLRYNFLHRSNGLNAHILSLSIQMEWDKKRK